MMNAGVMAILGFIFWNVATKNFTAVEIGLGSTLISAIGLIIAFSLLGANISLIRYLPKARKKSEIVWSWFWLSGIIAIVLSTGFLLCLGWFYPELEFVRNNLFYSVVFVCFAVFVVFFNFLEAIFIAQRKSKYVLLKNGLWSLLKIIMLFFFLSMAAYGIFSAWYLSAVIAILVVWPLTKLKVYLGIDLKLIKRMFKYSLGNYVGNIFAMLPGFGLPLFITFFLGASQTAYFYITWMIANLLFFVPMSIGRSFLSEGSHRKNHLDLKKSLKFTYFVTFIGLVLGLIMSQWILGFFGSEYLDGGFKILVILLVSSLFYSYNIIIVMYFNLKHEVRKVVSIYLAIALITFGLSYLMLDYGLVGIGFAWIIANLLVSVYLKFFVKK